MRRYFREPISGLTHFIAVLLAIVGLIVLLTRSNGEFTAWHAVSFSIFGGAMILVYSFSTLYHWLPLSGKSLEVIRRLDHIMIFVFIAASYTPICIVTMRGGWGWAIFGTVWGAALGGLFLKVFWLNAPRYLYTAVYLITGWIAIVAIWPLSKAIAIPGLVWIVLGGVFYSIGAVIYALKKPDPWPNVIGYHEIFHVFIVLGSISHYWVMYRYV